jgi:hypothetical protein
MYINEKCISRALHWCIELEQLAKLEEEGLKQST